MNTAELSLDEYQRRALAVDCSPEYQTAADMVLPLLRAVGEVEDVSEKRRKRTDKRRGRGVLDQSVRVQLGDSLRYIATLASRVGLTLEEVALANIGKADGTFDKDVRSQPPARFDTGTETDEQLSRQLVMHFEESKETEDGGECGPVTLRVLVNGETAFCRVSDPADDPNDIDDYWRYDVAFSMGYWAALGWSPVIRLILDPQHDQTDRGRVDGWGEQTQAVVIEKTLTADVFAVAAEHSFFETTTRVPYYLLKTCMRSTAREVKNSSVADWQHAILVGHNAFRFLIEHRSGVLVADLNERTLTPYTVEQYARVRAS